MVELTPELMCMEIGVPGASCSRKRSCAITALAESSSMVPEMKTWRRRWSIVMSSVGDLGFGSFGSFLASAFSSFLASAFGGGGGSLLGSHALRTVRAAAAVAAATDARASSGQRAVAAIGRPMRGTTGHPTSCVDGRVDRTLDPYIPLPSHNTRPSYHITLFPSLTSPHPIFDSCEVRTDRGRARDILHPIFQNRDRLALKLGEDGPERQPIQMEHHRFHVEIPQTRNPTRIHRLLDPRTMSSTTMATNSTKSAKRRPAQ